MPTYRSVERVVDHGVAGIVMSRYRNEPKEESKWDCNTLLSPPKIFFEVTTFLYRIQNWRDNSKRTWQSEKK